MPDAAASPPTDLHFLSIADAASLIERRQLSPVELTRAFLDRIAAIDPQINAYLLVTAERALDQARAAEAEIMAGRYRGAMHGIPFALKDIYCTAGIRTTSHSRTRADYVPDFDATTVAKLYAAGAVLLGKLATHEFAHGGPSFDLPWPPARNPWNRAYITGGSSSGSGASVAAGLAMGALGSDTGGSIRNPAALCGLVGLKPTYGLVSRSGVYTNSFSYDTAGPMTWTAEDCAIMLQAIAGHDVKDPASATRPLPDYRASLSGGIKGMRIGVLRAMYEQEVATPDATKTALQAAFEVLRKLGATLEDVRIRRADLPEENTQAILNRMKSERQRIASQARAEGAEASARIKADAERDRTVLLAEARATADKLRGEGEHTAIATYADAYQRDPQFFSVWRTLQAYRDGLTGGQSRMVVSTDDDFFKLLHQAPTAAAQP